MIQWGQSSVYIFVRWVRSTVISIVICKLALLERRKILIKMLKNNSPRIVLRKIPKFHLISWCENFVKRHSFSIVSSDSPETMRKRCLSTKFSHQEIRWNYGILRSVSCLQATSLCYSGLIKLRARSYACA